MRPNDEVAGPTKVVYILGSQRGGTTILGKLLGTLEDVSFAGEMRRLWIHGLKQGRSCGCGLPHDECPVWSQVLGSDGRFAGLDSARIARLQRAVVPNRHSWWHALRRLRRDTPARDSDQARYASIVADLYGSFARASAARVVVDSSKNPADAVLLASIPEVSACCVQLVRDPRSVVFSRHERVRRRRASRPRAAGTAYVSLAWLARHLLTEAVLCRYGKARALRIRYEDFVQRPRAALEAVYSLIGIAGSPPPVAPGGELDLPSYHTPAGDGRFPAERVVLRHDTRWRTELHPIDRAIATALTLPLLRRYGYPIRTKLRGSSAAVADGFPGRTTDA